MKTKPFKIAVGGYATQTFLDVDLRIDKHKDYDWQLNNSDFGGISLVDPSKDRILQELRQISSSCEVHIYASMQGYYSQTIVPQILSFLRGNGVKAILKISPVPRNIGEFGNLAEVELVDRNTEQEYKYDVALSFAGEDRSLAEKLATLLQRKKISVFYDRYEQSELWGKDLYQHLQKVYRDSSRYCVVFISEAYAQKLWTKHELRQAQERAFRENSEYILPLRIDDTEIPGLNSTTGYINLKTVSLEEVCELLAKKVSSRV